jgi:hypothetical protein
MTSQTMPTKLASDEFAVATNLFYIAVKKE